MSSSNDVPASTSASASGLPTATSPSPTNDPPPKPTQCLNIEEAMGQLVFARITFTQRGDNAAAFKVRDLGYEIFGEVAFDFGKQEIVEWPGSNARQEAREKAIFYMLRSWAEFDDARDEKNCEKIVLLGRAIYGDEKWDKQMTGFNEE